MNRDEAKAMIACLLWATQKARSNEIESIENVGGLSRAAAEKMLDRTSKWLGEYYEQNLAALTKIQDRLEAGQSVRGNELNNLLIIAQRFEPAIDICTVFWRNDYELPKHGLMIAGEDIEAVEAK